MIDRLTRVLGLNKPSMDLKVLTVSVCHTIHFMPHRAVGAAKVLANNKDECGGLGGLVGGPSTTSAYRHKSQYLHVLKGITIRGCRLY